MNRNTSIVYHRPDGGTFLCWSEDVVSVAIEESGGWWEAIVFYRGGGNSITYFDNNDEALKFALYITDLDSVK